MGKAISSIFAGDAARQQSKSMFFNQGSRPRVVIANNNAALGAAPAAPASAGLRIVTFRPREPLGCAVAIPPPQQFPQGFSK